MHTGQYIDLATDVSDLIQSTAIDTTLFFDDHIPNIFVNEVSKGFYEVSFLFLIILLFVLFLIVFQHLIADLIDTFTTFQLADYLCCLFYSIAILSLDFIDHTLRYCFYLDLLFRLATFGNKLFLKIDQFLDY